MVSFLIELLLAEVTWEDLFPDPSPDCRALLRSSIFLYQFNVSEPNCLEGFKRVLELFLPTAFGGAETANRHRCARRSRKQRGQGNARGEFAHGETRGLPGAGWPEEISLLSREWITTVRYLAAGFDVRETIDMLPLPSGLLMTPFWRKVYAKDEKMATSNQLRSEPSSRDMVCWNPDLPTERETLFKLQRGRARAGAECRFRQNFAHTSAAASTGPRPRGRGMSGKWLVQFDRPRASTGPRPRGRGMTHDESSSDLRESSFNGAAPARARNGSSRKRESPFRWCFNGAAPARARNEETALWKQLRSTRASTGPRPRGRGMWRCCNLPQ